MQNAKCKVQLCNIIGQSTLTARTNENREVRQQKPKGTVHEIVGVHALACPASKKWIGCARHAKACTPTIGQFQANRTDSVNGDELFLFPNSTVILL